MRSTDALELWGPQTLERPLKQVVSSEGIWAEGVAPACFAAVRCLSGAATNLASRSTDCTAVGAILCRCGAVAEAAELWREACRAADGWTMRMSAPAGSLPVFPCTAQQCLISFKSEKESASAT